MKKIKVLSGLIVFFSLLYVIPRRVGADKFFFLPPATHQINQTNTK